MAECVVLLPLNMLRNCYYCVCGSEWVMNANPQREPVWGWKTPILARLGHLFDAWSDLWLNQLSTVRYYLLPVLSLHIFIPWKPFRMCSLDTFLLKLKQMWWFFLIVIFANALHCLDFVLTYQYFKTWQIKHLNAGFTNISTHSSLCYFHSPNLNYCT